MTTEVTGTDLFCGGGGSSFGLEQIAGIWMRVAINHWRRAVDTHQVNHPHVEHDCADISQVDPRRYVSTDIAWMSPDCTKHTKATGVKRDQTLHTSDGRVLPMDPAERSRATMWDVVRFAEWHDYKAIIVENVTEVTAWGRFPAWCAAMESMDYELQMVWGSSAHMWAGGQAAATNRNRWYCVAHKKGSRRPDVAKWTSPHGQCTGCGFTGQLVKRWKAGSDAAGGVYRRQYHWSCVACGNDVEPPIVAASTAIDWSDLGSPLLGKDRAERTVGKVGSGLLKHAVDGMAVPFVVELRGGGSTTRAVSDPFSTITAKGNHHGLIVPPGWDPVTGLGSVRADQVSLADVRYRMVSPQERKVASGFSADYVLLGTGAEQVKMIGNAVTPNAARALGSAVIEALTGEVRLNPTHDEMELAA